MMNMKYMRRFILVILILLFVFISCSKKGAHEFTTSINEDGVEICVNSGGPKYSEPLYDIEETLSLGGEEPEPVLYQPHGKCLVDSEGNIYFSDEDRIKKFDPNGKFILFIGRPGEGPGEINHPNLIDIIKDTLICGQYQHQGAEKYQRYKVNGESVRRIRSPMINKRLIVNGYNSVVRFLGGNNLLFASSQYTKQDRSLVYQHAFGICDISGKFIKQLEIELDPVTTSVEMNVGSRQIAMGRFFILRYPIFSLYEKLSVLLPNGRDILVFNRKWNLSRIIHLQFTGDPVTLEEKEYWRKRLNKPNFPVKLDERFFPEYKPVACDILTDYSGKLWMKKGKDIHNNGEPPFSYMIIDRNGEYLADMTFPIMVYAVKHDQVYGFLTTEDGLLIFKRYRLKSRF